METNKNLFHMGLLSVTLLVTISCGQTNSGDTSVGSISENASEIVLKDYGNAPTVLDIEAYTMGNENFRTTLWTGKNLQVTLMTIPVGGDIGLELHPNIDQFLRIEQGEGQVLMGDTQNKLDFVQNVKADYSVFVPAGKWHNLVNTGKEPIKLYSIYAPVEHPHSTVHKTQSEALEAEHAHNTEM